MLSKASASTSQLGVMQTLGLARHSSCKVLRQLLNRFVNGLRIMFL